jgi:uncharacterized membrane protein YozB (DUF420 family)
MSDFYSVLPHLNATLNASSFVLLTSGYFFIRRGRVLAHKRCQLAALTASILFLISYVVYHQHHGTDSLRRAGNRAPNLFHDSDNAHDFGSSDRAIRHHHPPPRFAW